MPRTARLPDANPRDDPARAARQRRVQPRAARERRDRLGASLERPARRRGRAGDRRRPRLPRRRDHARDRALRLPGRPRPAGARCAGRRAGSSATPTSTSASYFLSRISIIAPTRPGMARWRKRLFIALARNAASPVAVLPPARRADGGDGLRRRAVRPPARASRLCARACPPGTPRAPAQSRRRRASGTPGASGSAIATPKRLARIAAERLDLHLAEAGQRRQVGASSAAVGRVAPDAGGLAVVALEHRGEVAAPAWPSSPGSDGWPASRGRPARARPPNVSASNPPRRSRSTSGPANAFCTVTCWSSTSPTSSASGSRRDQLVGLLGGGEVELLGHQAEEGSRRGCACRSPGGALYVKAALEDLDAVGQPGEAGATARHRRLRRRRRRPRRAARRPAALTRTSTRLACA